MMITSQSNNSKHEKAMLYFKRETIKTEEGSEDRDVSYNEEL